MAKITVTIPLVKHLNSYLKNWGDVYVNKTRGEQIWLSANAPTNYIGDELDDKNYIEFNDSDIFERLPKEMWQYIKIEKRQSKHLKEVIQEIKTLEKQV